MRQRPVASRLRCITYAWGSYPEDVRAQQHYGPFDRPLRQDRNLIRDKELFVDLLIDLTVSCTSTFLWRWENGYTDYSTPWRQPCELRARRLRRLGRGSSSVYLRGLHFFLLNGHFLFSLSFISFLLLVVSGNEKPQFLLLTNTQSLTSAARPMPAPPPRTMRTSPASSRRPARCSMPYPCSVSREK